jgi:diguanylate cyclase (GGDEF)-like protein
MAGERGTHSCARAWQAGNRIGVTFQDEVGPPPKGEVVVARSPTRPEPTVGQPSGATDVVRSELFRLRASLDEVPFGIVLLDAELRAQFVNRAYRRIWRLPDATADSKPPFIELMQHARDTRAHAIPPDQIDAYVAKRLALVRAGDPAPIDLRLTDGEVLRFQCSVLPDGGRMLSYTYVTDIVKHSDELEVLNAALDNVRMGVILLDPNLKVRFMNAAVRQIWKISADDLKRQPSYPELLKSSRARGTYSVPDDQVEAHIEKRIALVCAGDPSPVELRLSDGRTVRSQCTVLPDGGRMLTYLDISDLVQHAELLERYATVDGLTSLYNRRHFMSLAEREWDRFQRYMRPLSLMIIDIDAFKAINDRWGHDAGDRALKHVADLCASAKRSTDIIARIGGEEFAMLLPETTVADGRILAERLRRKVKQSALRLEEDAVSMTVSIGIAQGSLSMSAFDVLMKAADRALYAAKASGRNRTVCAIGAPIQEADRAAE